jgi:hypothetical protein
MYYVEFLSAHGDDDWEFDPDFLESYLNGASLEDCREFIEEWIEGGAFDPEEFRIVNTQGEVV